MEITDDNTRTWLEEIDAAKRRDKDFREKGKEICDIYSGKTESDFNILYSNTEVISPALYSQTPRPVVKRRFEDLSPLAKAVEEAGQRMLSYLVDTNSEDYEKFDESMQTAVIDGVLPGRGVTQIKFDSDDDVNWALVCTDSKKWDRVYFGYALKWSKVPWIAFEEYLDKDEAKSLFGDKIKEIKFTTSDDEEKSRTEESKQKTACFYQIWDKSDKTVKWISDQYDGYLKNEDDPLGITGFFPIPRPLRFIKKSNDMEPTALYCMYENQAKELNRITRRLNRIVEAIKARGAYDGNLGDTLGQLFDEDDNALIPADDASMLGEGGFAKGIWMLPIGELIAVATQLFQAREQCKRVIYEITGISDILRGQSVASETLGAQKIKEAWGSMRIKNLQRDVQGYVRDSLRIMLDIAAQNIPQKLWIKYTGLQYPTNDQKEKAKLQLDEIKMRMQQMQPQGMPPQMPPQPQMRPQPQQAPQIPPQVQKAMQEAQKVLSMPSWEDILDVLKDDLIRSYKIDIETNSTLDVEATEDKQLVGEFMNAMAQFMNGIGPLVMQGIMPFGAAKSMLLSICQRFRFGTEVEDEIKAMQPPKPQNQQQQKEMAQAKKKLEQEKEKAQKAARQAGDELDKRYNQLEQEKMKFDFDRKLFEAQRKFEEKLAIQKLDMNNKENEEFLKNMLMDHKREVQSMMDKQAVRLEKIMQPPGM